MALPSGLQRAGWLELLHTTLDVTEPSVEREQLGSEAKDAEAHLKAAASTAVTLSGFHHCTTQAAPLARGIDR